MKGQRARHTLSFLAPHFTAGPYGSFRGSQIASFGHFCHLKPAGWFLCSGEASLVSMAADRGNMGLGLTGNGRLASHTSAGKNLTENQRWENDLKSQSETAGDKFYSQTLEQGVQAATGCFTSQSLRSAEMAGANPQLWGRGARPAPPCPAHTLADLVTAPISEYRSELSGKFSTTMVHTWWRSDCLCTVSLTSGTFSR